MIKECPITINNEAVTVCKYEDVLVQFPSIHDKNAKMLKVSYKNGLYKIVVDDKKPQTKNNENEETTDGE